MRRQDGWGEARVLTPTRAWLPSELPSEDPAATDGAMQRTAPSGGGRSHPGVRPLVSVPARGAHQAQNPGALTCAL